MRPELGNNDVEVDVARLISRDIYKEKNIDSRAGNNRNKWQTTNEAKKNGTVTERRGRG